MTYFTSDQHFGHFNIIRLSQRPFASLEEKVDLSCYFKGVHTMLETTDGEHTITLCHYPIVRFWGQSRLTNCCRANRPCR